MNINDWLKQLLTKDLEKGEPLVSANLNRSDKYLQKFEKFKSHTVWKGFIENTYKVVCSKQSNQNYSGMEPGYYHSSASNGFYLAKIESFDPDWFRFLADLMVSNLKNHSYIIQRKAVEWSEGNETQVCWEKYYLKPKPISSPKHRQQFGNIHIEFKLIDNLPSLFKIQANYYSGFNYKEPLPFDDLINTLFTSSFRNE